MLGAYGLHIRIIVALAGKHAEILALERRELVFGQFQLAFVILDLI